MCTYVYTQMPVCLHLYSTCIVTRCFKVRIFFKFLKGTFIYPIDNWSSAIWAMWKIWVVVQNQVDQIKHLAQTTIWRPKHMTWDDQIKLTFGALAVLSMSFFIWKSCSIIAIPISFAIQFAIFRLMPILKPPKWYLRISELSKGIYD